MKSYTVHNKSNHTQIPSYSGLHPAGRLLTGPAHFPPHHAGGGMPHPDTVSRPGKPPSPRASRHWVKAGTDPVAARRHGRGQAVAEIKAKTRHSTRTPRPGPNRPLSSAGPSRTVALCSARPAPRRRALRGLAPPTGTLTPLPSTPNPHVAVYHCLHAGCGVSEPRPLP